MAKVSSEERCFDFGMYGSLGRAYYFGERIYSRFHYGEEEYQINKNEYGVKLYGSTIYGTDDIRIGIYQRRHKQGKTIYARLKFYTPSNPQTILQQTYRQKFKNGMTAWANLTNEQRAEYNERANKLHLFGVNLFIKEWLKSH